MAIAAGLGLRVILTDDEGHHDGRSPTFALDPALGADELVVGQVGDESAISVAMERAGQPVTDFDDVWTDGDLTITRQGFDFVLSEPWDGDDYDGAPAFLTLFRAEDMAFVHDHASVPESNVFRFQL